MAGNSGANSPRGAPNGSSKWFLTGMDAAPGPSFVVGIYHNTTVQDVITETEQKTLHSQPSISSDQELTLQPIMSDNSLRSFSQ